MDFATGSCTQAYNRMPRSRAAVFLGQSAVVGPPGGSKGRTLGALGWPPGLGAALALALHWD